MTAEMWFLIWERARKGPFPVLVVAASSAANSHCMYRRIALRLAAVACARGKLAASWRAGF